MLTLNVGTLSSSTAGLPSPHFHLWVFYLIFTFCQFFLHVPFGVVFFFSAFDLICFFANFNCIICIYLGLFFFVIFFVIFRFSRMSASPSGMIGLKPNSRNWNTRMNNSKSRLRAWSQMGFASTLSVHLDITKQQTIYICLFFEAWIFCSIWKLPLLVHFQHTLR